MISNSPPPTIEEKLLEAAPGRPPARLRFFGGWSGWLVYPRLITHRSSLHSADQGQQGTYAD